MLQKPRSLHLAPESAAAQEKFMQAMKTVCCVYMKDFRNLQETNELQSGGILGESVDLLLCKSLYIVCRQQDLQKGDFDVFNAKEIEVFGNFTKFVLNGRWHGDIFYFGV